MPVRLDVLTLFLKAYALFKTNFQQVIVFGIMSALLAGMVRFVPESSEALSVLKTFLSLAMSLIQIWITIALILLIDSTLIGEELSVKQAFSKGKEFYGSYFLTNILFGFRVLVIAIPVMLLFLQANHVLLYVTGGIVGFLGLLYVFIHFSLAPLMRVLNPEVETPFATNFSLVKKYRLEIFFVFVGVGLLTLATQLTAYFQVVNQPISVLIEGLSSAFVFPFTTIVSVILYHFLVDQHHAETTHEEDLNTDND